MCPRIDFDLKGAKEMENLLLQLGSPRVVNRLGDRALIAATKPIITEAKRLVRKKTRRLERAITAVVATRRRDGERVVYIGFKKAESWRAHFIEYGTAHAPAYPFMRPALDSQAPAALDEMGRVLGEGITTEAEKLARK